MSFFFGAGSCHQDMVVAAFCLSKKACTIFNFWLGLLQGTMTLLTSSEVGLT